MAIRTGSNKFYERFVPGGWKPGDPSEVLTPAGHQYLRVHGVPPPHDEVRADSAATGDGLRKITHVDPETGRRTYEFENVGARKTWMQNFMSPAYRMLRVAKEPQTPEQNARFEASWRETQSQIASGKIELPEL